MNIINPYANIDFATAQRVRSITHEHIYSAAEWKSCYDRGIRHFPAMHYLPSVPRFPASNFYHKIEGGAPVLAEYTDFIDVMNGDFSTRQWTLQGGVSSFQDADGVRINTDDLPQVPNNEHPTFTQKLGVTTEFLNHFNVLGNLWPECGWGQNNGTTAQRAGQPLSDLSDFSKFWDTGNQYFANKLLFTINHCASRVSAEVLLQAVAGRCPIAFEIFNDDYSDNYNAQFVKLYDELLSDGYRLFVSAVIDWQGYVCIDLLPEEASYWQTQFNALTPEQQAKYGDYKEYYKSVGRTRDYDCGCNVLFVPSDYDSLPANDFLTISGESYPNKHSDIYTKAEAGLDSYIAGKYYASAFGNHAINDLSVSGGAVTFSVDNTATSVSAITNKRRIQGVGNSVSVSIKPGESYLRFEARFNNDEKPDFIFTNPLWIEDNPDTNTAERLLLLLD